MSEQKEIALRLENQKRELEIELIKIQKDFPESSMKKKKELEKDIKAISHGIRVSK